MTIMIITGMAEPTMMQPIPITAPAADAMMVPSIFNVIYFSEIVEEIGSLSMSLAI